LFKLKIVNQWSKLYDADDGTSYMDCIQLNDVGRKFILVWIGASNKYFKINVESSLKLKIIANRQINLFELRKQLKKECGFGNDMIFTESNLNVFDNYSLTNY
jgi:hypothetical protein